MSFRTFSIMSLALGLTGCVIAPDFLFKGAIDGVPSILHITAPDGGLLVPADVVGAADPVAAAQAATIYAELGPTGDANRSGLTYEFAGTGGSVCVFVDPELVHWNQSVASQGADPRWRFPDNPWDDGDVDLRAGLSVYYTGTINEVIGDFLVGYQDSLGNTVDINLVACSLSANVLGPTPIATAGRGSPEFCTVFNTQPGVKYTVALEVFSTPPDDNRLGLGMLLADGSCTDVINAVSPSTAGNLPGNRSAVHHECVIRGEALKPVKGEGALFYGYEEGRSWAGSEDFEDWFCDANNRISDFCSAEADFMADQGLECNWENTVDFDTLDLIGANRRCFCGDVSRTPVGGAF